MTLNVLLSEKVHSIVRNVENTVFFRKRALSILACRARFSPSYKAVQQISALSKESARFLRNYRPLR
ncbi:hypothetical protein [Caballeronia sp. BR00000012568055]|uniref:hypothetical protein n=1 Tax=Caballeronia sp. BR00000012568055 TaxID=2918761 RepID=UPI0023FA371A|nr:hypothetical protein [Caballeronia sp. BR00000012568055]